jgi:uncharacterized cupredoxin-like copper-binding protein
MKQVLTLRDTFNEVQSRAAFAGMVILLALLAMLCLSGCGGTAKANSAAAGTSNTQAQAPATNGRSASEGSMPDMAMPDETVAGANDANRGSADNQISSQQVEDSGVISGNETVVQAALVEWSIQLSRTEVPAGKIRFVVANQGKMPHNLTVQDTTGVIAATPNFRPAQGPQTLDVELKPGTYTLLCSIPGHAKKGQVTTLVVK